ncbi:MAG: hypothetical protein ACXWIN_06955 [Burkholderiaceae bacterium]
MQHTIAAVFNNPIEAQQACDALVSAGFSRDGMRLSQNDDIERPADALLDEEAERDSDSPGAAVRSFFAEVFGPARRTDAELYAEAVRRGNVVLTINVPEDDLLDQVTDVIDQFHPIDVDEQAAKWKSGGWAAPESMREEEPPKQATSNVRDTNMSPDRSQSTVNDELRSIQLDIENLPGTPDLFGASAEADRERDDAYYKDHWNQNYASSGGKYEDYAPAYKHGALLAGSEQYKGRQWNEAESDVKSDWASKNPDSTWEKIKNAVRHGWESMTNRINS